MKELEVLKTLPRLSQAIIVVAMGPDWNERGGRMEGN